MIHQFRGETLGYELVFKKRTSMGIFLDYYGNVEVHVPKGTSAEDIRQLLENNWETIIEKTTEVKNRLSGNNEKVYEQGEHFLYLGKEYPIFISQDKKLEKDQVIFEEDKLFIVVRKLDDESIKQALKRFYYRQCKSMVEKRMQIYQEYFKMKPRSIKITDSQKTWGTCDSMRRLTFNWKLSMAPLKVIDYVVVHEMCHMLHLNHDRSFWRLVGKILPDYEQCENWLAHSRWKMNL